MKNNFEVRGDITTIFLHRRDGSILEALIDTADLAIVQGYRWVANKSAHHKSFYVKGFKPCSKSIYLHRLLFNDPKGFLVDHINGSGLDNRRNNLRLADKSLNAQNRTALDADNKSGYRGVSWHEQSKRWRAIIRLNGKQIRLGSFLDVEVAARVVAEARAKLMPYSQEARQSI